MVVHTLPKGDTRSHPQCTNSIQQTKEAQRFSCFISGNELSRGTQDQQFLFMEVATVLAEAKEGRARVFLPVPSTPLGKGSSPMLGFIYSEMKLNNAFD